MSYHRRRAMNNLACMHTETHAGQSRIRLLKLAVSLEYAH